MVGLKVCFLGVFIKFLLVCYGCFFFVFCSFEMFGCFLVQFSFPNFFVSLLLFSFRF